MAVIYQYFLIDINAIKSCFTGWGENEVKTLQDTIKMLIDLVFSLMMENHLFTWSPPYPNELLSVLLDDTIYNFFRFSQVRMWKQ